MSVRLFVERRRLSLVIARGPDQDDSMTQKKVSQPAAMLQRSRLQQVCRSSRHRCDATDGSAGTVVFDHWVIRVLWLDTHCQRPSRITQTSVYRSRSSARCPCLMPTTFSVNQTTAVSR